MDRWGREAGEQAEDRDKRRNDLRPRWDPSSRDGIWSGLPGIEAIDDDELEPGDELGGDRWWQAHADRQRDPDHQRRIELIPADRRPASFRPELAERTPEWGTKGEKTSGTVDLGDRAVDLVSGYDGPTKDLPSPRPGMHRITMAHVEAHAAATMRIKGVAEATLYINRIPCPSQRRYRGCDESLPTMLPAGGKLTLYGPDGFCRVYTGLEDKQP